MTYNIKKYDNTPLVSINDGFVDTESTSLSLIGKNVENFGTLQNENYVHLLEHFADDTAPLNPIRGQLWYNTVKKQVFVYDGTAFILLGPESTANFGTTKLSSVVVLDTNSSELPIIQVIVNGEILAIISAVEFTPQTTITGFPIIYRGVTFNSYNTNNNSVRLFGKAMVAATAETSITKPTTDDSTNIATTQFVHNILPTGVILMWSGEINTIPSGWALCDGSVYGSIATPDLSGRFIRGASTLIGPNNIGGSDSQTITTDSAGVHSHGITVNGTTLTVEQMPQHQHASPNSVDCLPENEKYPFGSTIIPDVRVGTFCDAGPGTVSLALTNLTGGGQSHTHVASVIGDGTHSHNIPTINILPSWYSLCYIMKIV